MDASLRFLALAVLLLCSTHAGAQVVLGQLELKWGDPLPRPQAVPSRFVATLVTDEGGRFGIPGD